MGRSTAPLGFLGTIFAERAGIRERNVQPSALESSGRGLQQSDWGHIVHRKTLRFIGAASVAALGLASPALGHPGEPGDPTPPVEVVIDQSNFDDITGDGWGLSPDFQVPSGTAELAAGPFTPPSGTGSLRLFNTDSGQLTTVANSSDFEGTLLSSVSKASYATFVDADSTAGPTQISLKFGVEGTTLVFEPYYADNTRALQRGVWNTWDAAGASTGWWDTQGLTSCTMAAPCSFTQMKNAIDPEGTVTLNDVRLAVGRGPSHFDGNVDALSLKVGAVVTHYDFESNAADDDVVTRVDETNAGGWSVDGNKGTASNGFFDARPAGGPSGASGGASMSLLHQGAGSYVSVLQDYEADGDLTQRYLGKLDNIEADTYKLSTSTNTADYPTVRFEVRLADPTTQFAFTSIIHEPAATSIDTIDHVKAIHDPANTVDSRTWRVSKDIAGLTQWTYYTWSELMRTPLRDAVILKTRVMSGAAGGGAFSGGVDVLRLSFRDGSSQTWDFQKVGFPQPAAAPSAPTDLTAAAATSSTNVTLGWTDTSTTEDGFLLERSTSSTFLPAAGVVSITLPRNATTHVDTGLTANTTYYYRVAAGNGAGLSPYSNTASATTIANPPTPDTTSPTVQITTESGIILPFDPMSGDETFTDIAGTASDNVAVVAVSVALRDAFGSVVAWPVVCGANVAPDCPTVAPGQPGSWSVRFAVPIASFEHPPGVYSVTAYAVDAAGNLTESESIDIITLR